MRRLVSIAAFALLAVPSAAAPSTEPLLALRWNTDRELQVLSQVDPATLAPLRSLELRDKGISKWSRSPDGGSLALGAWDAPRITIVDLVGFRVAREVRVPPGRVARGRDVVIHGRYAQELAWVAPRRLLALVGSCCTAEAAIAVFDPGSGRVLTERTVPGSVRGVARLPDGLVLLTGAPGIGPSRLAVVGPDGRIRVASLPRTRAGSRRLGDDPYAFAVRTPGLAVDPEARLAYVFGADEPVAEVDLRTMRVTYRALAPAHSLQARAKDIRGPYRTATWIGDGAFAVTGTNARRRAGRLRFEPVGVHLVDTRSWQRRTLAPRAQTFAVGGRTVVVPLASALAVFGSDGVERFRVPGGFGWVQTAGGRAYAWREGGPMLVVDLQTGATSSVATEQPPALLGP